MIRHNRDRTPEPQFSVTLPISFAVQNPKIVTAIYGLWPIMHSSMEQNLGDFVISHHQMTGTNDVKQAWILGANIQKRLCRLNCLMVSPREIAFPHNISVLQWIIIHP